MGFVEFLGMPIGEITLGEAFLFYLAFVVGKFIFDVGFELLKDAARRSR